MTAPDNLPVRAVTDVLRGFQELTHYLYFLELTFDVFNDSSPASAPIASGCLAFDCSTAQAIQTRDVEIANLSQINASSVPSRRLQSTAVHIPLTSLRRINSVSVNFDELQHPLPISGQSFADVADRILANITNLIIAHQGDGLLPFFSTGRRLFHYVDTWGSNLGISLLPYNLLGVNFTLSQAAMALKATQNQFDSRPMRESLLQIEVDGVMVGWGCLRYTNTSAWRCLMPYPNTQVGGREWSPSSAELFILRLTCWQNLFRLGVLFLTLLPRNELKSGLSKINGILDWKYINIIVIFTRHHPAKRNTLASDFQVVTNQIAFTGDNSICAMFVIAKPSSSVAGKMQAFHFVLFFSPSYIYIIL